MTTQVFTRFALSAITTLAATSLWTALPEAAQALTVTRTINGTSYDITTVTGTFNDLQSTLTNSATVPWWGKQSLAFDFTQAVADSLEFPNFAGRFGSFFAYWSGGIGSVSPTLISSYNWTNPSFFGAGAVGESFFDSLNQGDAVKTFAIATAVATPVPTPALLPGLVGMGIAAYRKHKQASSITASSTNT
jgi:hypothetical protein